MHDLDLRKFVTFKIHYFKCKISRPHNKTPWIIFLYEALAITNHFDNLKYKRLLKTRKLGNQTKLCRKYKIQNANIKKNQLI